MDAERVKAQMRRWQDQVLDLTKSNPLLSLNRSRVSRLEVTGPTAHTLFSALVVDGNQLRMPLVRKRTESADDLFSSEGEGSDFVVQAGDITFDARPLDLMRRLRRIHDNSRTSMEERGVTTLYLTFGALHWKDDQIGESVSPLWMVPCELESKGPETALRLSAADEDAQINPALEYYLRERHKIQLPELPEEADEGSPTGVLDSIRCAVKEQPWHVTEEVWLSTFSFESLVIYRDLKALVDTGITHPIVCAFSRATTTADKSEALHDLDTLPSPATVPIPTLPADSSQLEALTLCSLGRHVVVHGPPGTGKSQTIANLIADALTRSKKVLFVSAKMAALNVVYERLKSIGLQSFCLEAHSTKAGKQKIIDELKRTLDAEISYDGNAIEQELQKLLRIRDQLNAYAKELHQIIEPLGLSVYRANARLAQLAEIDDVAGTLPWSNPVEVSRDDFERRKQTLEALAENASVFDERETHPWSGFSPKAFGLPEHENLETALREALSLSNKIASLAEQLGPLLPDAQCLSLRDWVLLRVVLGAIAETERLPDTWWQENDERLATFAELFMDAAKQRRELDLLSSEIQAEISGNLAELIELLSPIRDRFKAWHSLFRPAYWRWRKVVKLALKPGVRFGRAHLDSLRARCSRASEIEEWFHGHAAAIESRIDPSEISGSAAMERIARSFTVAVLCRRVLAALGREPEPIVVLSDAIRKAARELLLVISADSSLPPQFLRLDRDWPRGFARGKPASKAPLPEVANRSASLLESKRKAREWVLLDRALQQCDEAGLSEFIESFGITSAKNAPCIFERRFLKHWVSAAIDRSPTLAGFTEAKGRDLLTKFRELDERVRQLAISRAQRIACSASDRVRTAEDLGESASEVGILRRELQKRKRVKPLRKLFSEIPHVMQALKPCLLMSPISVSTYLKPGTFHFDLVVFDEASQLPIAEAVPAILRASQVVVAGDPNQLPPTSFFQTSLVTEEQDEDETEGGQAPLESLLDECVAVVPIFQQSHLRWHYRSRDERLIRFSNHFFYENKLITFPAAGSSPAGQGVRFVYVPDGVYDRGRSRMNRPEARVVARLALEHFERDPDRSLGIVALNLSQKDAIEDAISEALLSRPDLSTFFDQGRHEGVFIKSLENVQGDERDTMIISVGYGRDHAGGLSMNFGPINADGGWRRLNVLVTRAKWECVLVSSLRYQDLSGVNPNNRGAVSLRAFHEFAEKGGELPSEMAVQTDSETNEFEEAVRAALVDRGLKVDMQVGASRYRIDLAVRDPRDEGQYILGIECDGIAYHSSRTARDRDLLRQLVLQRMGWRIHRLWSTEWFHDRDQAIESILRSVEQARSTPLGRPVYAPPPVFNSPQGSSTTRPWSSETIEIKRRYSPGISYMVFQSARKLNREYLMDAAYQSLLVDTITSLVKVEGPIHQHFLIERLKDVHAVARAGSNVQSNIDCALRSAVHSHKISKMSFFYCTPEGHLECFRLATDSVRRPIEYIAPSELSLAVLYLVEDQFGIFEDSLPTAVARLFGVERLRNEAAEIIRRVTDDLVSRGLLRRSGMQVHLG